MNLPSFILNMEMGCTKLVKAIAEIDERHFRKQAVDILRNAAKLKGEVVHLEQRNRSFSVFRENTDPKCRRKRRRKRERRIKRKRM